MHKLFSMFQRCNYKPARFHIYASLGLATASLAIQPQKLNCSPMFQGVPVAATFIMNQAIPIFNTKFPGLEVSAVFAPGMPGHVYEEQGGIGSLYPTRCVAEVPVYEKLHEEEEKRLGSAGIRKKPVGILVSRGECKYGCASVVLCELEVLKYTDEGELDRLNPIWVWKKKN